jgi:hypothetical protein
MAVMSIGISTAGIAALVGMAVVGLALIAIGMRRRPSPAPATPPSRRRVVLDFTVLGLWVALALSGTLWLRLLVGFGAAVAFLGVLEAVAWWLRAGRGRVQPPA